MKIPIIDDIVMTKDSHNIILNRQFIVEKGEDIGKTKLKAYAWFPDVVSALESVVSKKMNDSKARTLLGLVASHDELVALFREKLGVVGKLES